MPCSLVSRGVSYPPGEYCGQAVGSVFMTSAVAMSAAVRATTRYQARAGTYNRSTRPRNPRTSCVAVTHYVGQRHRHGRGARGPK
jgi:hypothetical protein